MQTKFAVAALARLHTFLLIPFTDTFFLVPLILIFFSYIFIYYITQKKFFSVVAC